MFLRFVVSLMIFVGTINTVFATNAMANGLSTILIPTCLLDSSLQYRVLAKEKNILLIQVNEENLLKVAELKHKNKCGGFIDVTHNWHEFPTISTRDNPSVFLQQQMVAKTVDKPTYEIKYEKAVIQLLNQLNPQNILNNLTTLTRFPNRFANSDQGVLAANWIKTQLQEMAKTNNRDDVSFIWIPTGKRYKQPSLVMKLGTSTKPGIVIGSHMDTLDSKWELKPGADDDGSGSMTVLETARIFLESHMQFDRPIYFIWYAAEEMGLVGSQYVVADFQKRKIPVAAVLQLDMTGYAYKNESTLWLMTDNVNQSLTSFVADLIQKYVQKPVQYSKCGYACSDHAIWTKNGYIAAMPMESAMEHDNPAIHTSRDTIENLSLDHMTDYAKLAVSFGVELAEPVDTRFLN